MKIQPGKDVVLVSLTPRESMALARKLIQSAIESGGPLAEPTPETEHKAEEQHG